MQNIKIDRCLLPLHSATRPQPGVLHLLKFENPTSSFESRKQQPLDLAMVDDGSPSALIGDPLAAACITSVADLHPLSIFGDPNQIWQFPLAIRPASHHRPNMAIVESISSKSSLSANYVIPNIMGQPPLQLPAEIRSRPQLIQAAILVGHGRKVCKILSIKSNAN
ncbi:hypothetical protein ACLOJK_034296 [Asimina triloba]